VKSSRLSARARRRVGVVITGSDHRRRATELLARSLAHEDAEADGLCAAQLLADPGLALALLGSPDAAPAARDAVVQRFGLVGALLVVGHEDRWRRRLAAATGDDETVAPDDEVSGHLEQLVQQFARLDARRLELLLRAIDRAEGDRAERASAPDRATVARHRLHATYAVAARDGSDRSHHAYMASLNEVLRMTRPSLAS
jgi:hypothetical protein